MSPQPRARGARDRRVDAALAELSPELRVISARLRRRVGSAAPELEEHLKWGNPIWVGQGNVVVLMLFDHHINLGFFHGARMLDAFPQLQGTGKGLRHLQIRTLKDANDPAIGPMLREALRLDALPS